MRVKHRLRSRHFVQVGAADQEVDAAEVPDERHVPVPPPARRVRQLISEDSNAASVLLVQVVKTLSERLRRANQMLSSVDLLADWLAGSMV